jgi:pimeloyl-ACP methyl ester carboxylesterase
MPSTVINGVRLYWELTGDSGDPFVLVHGSWGDHHNWDLVVADLSRSFRVLTYDRRGHSQSERPAKQGSVREDVADLAALIKHLALGPAHIAGNSFGGSIVLRLAGEQPGLFRSLVVHEPPLFGLLVNKPMSEHILSEVERRVEAVVDRLKAGDSAEGARLFVETIAFGPGAWERLSASLQQTFVRNAPTWLDETQDPEALKLDVATLRNFERPSLLTHGVQSPPFFGLIIAELVEALSRGEQRLFVNAGHVPHLSHPKEYVQAVTEFAKR